MRKGVHSQDDYEYKIIGVDDELGILDSLKVFLNRAGYGFIGVSNPLEAIEKVKTEHFDLMLLDYIMTPIHGDQVVEEIRKFNKDLYILLLTGHKDLAPPLDTIKRLDIQGYCEKSDKFDQLLLLIESGVKAISQMNLIKDINNELKDTYDKLEKAYLETIQVLRYTVEAKDTYTRGHSDRVSEFSMLLGQKLGLSDKEIKNHTSIGAHILSNATIFKEVIPIVKHHHERYDGNGYPGKLKGEEIPLLARITAVADAFDAMSSKRTYRNSLDIDTVKAEIERCKGTQFDPKCADAFLDILNNHYNEIKEIQEKYKSE